MNNSLKKGQQVTNAQLHFSAAGATQKKRRQASAVVQQTQKICL
jgi:hypothetical protein